MRTFRGAWPLAGLVAGAAGLATSYFVAMALSIRTSPVVAVGDLVIRLTPGRVAERLISVVGHLDKPLLVAGILVVLGSVFAWTGRLSRRTSWAPMVVFVVLSLVGGVAVARERGATTVDLVPVAVGLLTWVVALSLLTEPLRRSEPVAAPGPVSTTTPVRETVQIGGGLPSSGTRRGFVVRAGVVAAGAAVLGVAGRVVGRGRRRVEEARQSLRLPEVTKPVVPAGAVVGVQGISSWETAASDFYRVHTAIVVPTIEPREWSLRIHGEVEQPITLSYADLVARRFTEAWITLNCVSNPVGGDLIGNAWWSGVRVADVLAAAGPRPGADAVLQTSEDGWTCGTPLSVLTDDRNALLAVAMNGQPLPIEHGFPVRVVVPGLYGYVSACKWVVDMEVTGFDRISAYWTERGWSEEGPVKMASRVDVPRSGAHVAAGTVTFGGVAWAQHTGIQGVEFAVDGGEWLPGQVAAVATDDTWVQWKGTTAVDKGDHTVRVRAVDKTGTVQTGVQHDVLPDGATGWHSSDFSAS